MGGAGSGTSQTQHPSGSLWSQFPLGISGSGVLESGFPKIFVGGSPAAVGLPGLQGASEGHSALAEGTSLGLS